MYEYIPATWGNTFYNLAQTFKPITCTTWLKFMKWWLVMRITMEKKYKSQWIGTNILSRSRIVRIKHWYFDSPFTLPQFLEFDTFLRWFSESCLVSSSVPWTPRSSDCQPGPEIQQWMWYMHDQRNTNKLPTQGWKSSTLWKPDGGPYTIICVQT